MQRRKLIKQLAYALPAGMIIPGLLESCKDAPNLVETPSFDGTVIIIGGGLAGIYAAELLRKYSINTLILEASNRFGGRVLSQNTFSDIPVELGGAEIKGQRSVLYDMAVHTYETELVKQTNLPFFWLDNQLRSQEFLNGRPDGATLFQTIDSFGTYPGSNISFKDYLDELSLPENYRLIANGLVGNKYGAENESIGMVALRELAESYSSGKNSYVLQTKSILQFIQESIPNGVSAVGLNKRTTKIDYSGDKIIVTCADGTFYPADKVLVTVPISILKSGDIEFSPVLPQRNQSAIDRMTMKAGMKVILKFNTQFWDTGASSIIGGDLVPEYIVSNSGKNSANALLTAFICGERAQALSALEEQDAVNQILEELGSIFNVNTVNAAYSGQFLMKDWLKDPNIRGAYSVPSLGSENARPDLAAPVSNRIYFAGEATNLNGHSGTMHGAIESSIRAVQEILEN